MTAVVVPWQMSAGADWPLMLTVCLIVACAFYLERRPTQRQIVAAFAFVLAAGVWVFAGDLVMVDPCSTVDTWWERMLIGCWWR
jgi:uncharacterized membrane protein YgdD (TMEM256/DUF423 family)